MIEKIKDLLTEIPTPSYFYDIDILEKTTDNLLSNSKDFLIFYSLKANSNPKILEVIRKKGLGAEVVSIGELKLALEFGFKNIVMSGVGKTDEQIKLAIINDIESINIESIQEIEVVDQISQELNKTARVSLRVNPNVDPLTHKAITTGLSENKFGINFEYLGSALDKIKKSSSIEFIGLHFHIGSQITDMSVFKNLCIRVNEIIEFVLERKFNLKMLNLGGGLGIDYHNPNNIPNFKEYFDTLRKFLSKPKNVKVCVEPGRSVVGQCGTLISKVLFKKEFANKELLILDSGMNHLIRPALYEAFHMIQNLTKIHEKPTNIYDIHGPICESTDCFAKNVLLPLTNRGDHIAIRSAGAYGEVMISDYNLRGKPNFVFMEKNKIVR
ncbi:MAG: diaminopimelate decarboxylase [bacterium]|nr:diaminopimelate decarboxylase [bacterium]